jgi:hypothetical protein
MVALLAKTLYGMVVVERNKGHHFKSRAGNPHRTTGTSLIIVVRLDAFKTAALLRSALAQMFQLHGKVRRSRWSILAWGLWDGLSTGVLEIVLLLSKSL